MKTKICVTRAVDHATGLVTAGVFEWEGRGWRTGRLTRLVRAMPNATDGELRAAYREELAKRMVS